MIWKPWAQWTLIIIAFLLFSIWGRIYRHNADRELQYADEVNSKVIQISAARGTTVITVEYIYRGDKIKNDFEAGADTFKVGDAVLIKVSKRYPGKHISFLRKIKSQ